MSQFSNIARALPPVTKHLIIINFIIWLVMLLNPAGIGSLLDKYCALHYLTAPDFNPAQLFTYMFMHSTSSVLHILFNMFTLFMFGLALERVLGSKRFLFYYISCGIGAALMQELVWALTWQSIFIPQLAMQNGVSADVIREAIRQAQDLGQDLPFLNYLITIGASGAVYGILLGFGMLFPNRPLYIMFIPVPVKAKWVMIGYGVIELLIGLSAANDGVAHFAHLGGMLIGLVMILYWKSKRTIHGDNF